MLIGPGPGFEDLDDHEATLAAEGAGVDVATGEALHHVFQVFFFLGLGFGLTQKLATEGELFAAVAVGEKPIMASLLQNC